MIADRTRIQACLNELNAGDASAWNRLLPLVYDQLRREAHAVFRDERVTLQATALLHEALADLLEHDLDQLKFESPSRFFALASRIIRNRLQDHIRSRKAAKRGGGVRLSFDEAAGDALATLASDEIQELHEALEELRALDERLWTVIEFKFFYRMMNKEIAKALGVSAKTVESDWTFARAWLKKRLAATD